MERSRWLPIYIDEKEIRIRHSKNDIEDESTASKNGINAD